MIYGTRGQNKREMNLIIPATGINIVEIEDLTIARPFRSKPKRKIRIDAHKVIPANCKKPKPRFGCFTIF